MPVKKYRHISFVISPEMEAELKAEAVNQERSASWIIKKALAEYLLIRATAPKPKIKKKPGSR